MTNVLSLILILISVMIIFISHEKLCKIPKMFGFEYCLPHWVFIYMIAPAFFLLALIVKHQSAGFFDFATKQLRDITENPNKDTL